MTDVVVRLLNRSDAPLFEKVADDVFDAEIQADLVREFLNDPRSLMSVALHSGVIVGMASAVIYVHPDKPRQLFINEVGVAPPYQRRGVGRRLVSALLDRARELGCSEAWVATEVENHPPRSLYEALGGVEDSPPAVLYLFDLTQEDRSEEGPCEGTGPDGS
ncbi:GNAT family N-acetyltransferase [Tautonia rosea]|uniref:GNAT family N-acetyltransferase n=1 Tax=Tautonia rosea TaxID=2728037 RepID=UPI0014735092|nr:GNAT family N-acetyltransferase [Tautonia rosea]